jgi:hypothetical protein
MNDGDPGVVSRRRLRRDGYDGGLVKLRRFATII